MGGHVGLWGAACHQSSVLLKDLVALCCQRHILDQCDLTLWVSQAFIRSTGIFLFIVVSYFEPTCLRERCAASASSNISNPIWLHHSVATPFQSPGPES